MEIYLSRSKSVEHMVIIPLPRRIIAITQMQRAEVQGNNEAPALVLSPATSRLLHRQPTRKGGLQRWWSSLETRALGLFPSLPASLNAIAGGAAYQCS